MRLSYEKFNQFGANARKFAVTAYGTSKAYISPLSESQLRQAFLNQNWVVESVTYEWINLYDLYITVVGLVFDNFKETEIRDGAKSVILNNGFYVTDIFAVLGDPATINVIKDQSPTNTKPTNTKPTTNNSSNSNNNSSDPYSYFPSSKDLGIDGFLTSLGSGLGVSTPLVIGGLLVLGIVVLKR